MQAKRRLQLENVLNCRDLGGYPSKYGTTKFGRFLRAGIVFQPTEEDLNALAQYGIKTVIDLRGGYEAKNNPYDFGKIHGVKHYHMSLYDANVALENELNMTLQEKYEFIADNHMRNVADVLNLIANADDGAILFHCYFGKDRTGILSMLLLTIAGVSNDDIVADYQQSYTYLKDFISEHSEILWSNDSTMHYSLPETMYNMLEHIYKKYGSVMGYLKSAGVSYETTEKIRRKFFE